MFQVPDGGHGVTALPFLSLKPEACPKKGESPYQMIRLGNFGTRKGLSQRMSV